MSTTIAGFSTAEVCKSLMERILQGDHVLSQRWAAELLCSEKGYTKLLTIYSYLGFSIFLSSSTAWINYCKKQMAVLEDQWRGSGGSLRVFRNATLVRSVIAEWTEIWCQQRQSSGHKIPSKRDVIKAAPEIKKNLKSTQSRTNLQASVAATWKANYDADDIRVLANEMMYAIQYHQVPRALFYYSWLMELEDERAKGGFQLLKRGPSFVSDNQKSHVAWFIYNLLDDYAISMRVQKERIRTVLQLWRDCWFLFNKNQRKQTLGGIVAWLAENTFSEGPLIQNSEQLRNTVADHESVYAIIKKDKERHEDEKEENEDKSNVDTNRPKTSEEKMKEVNEKLASIWGISWDELEEG